MFSSMDEKHKIYKPIESEKEKIDRLHKEIEEQYIILKSINITYGQAKKANLERVRYENAWKCKDVVIAPSLAEKERRKTIIDFLDMVFKISAKIDRLQKSFSNIARQKKEHSDFDRLWKMKRSLASLECNIRAAEG